MSGRNVASSSVDIPAGPADEEEVYATDEESMFIDGESTVAAWRGSQQITHAKGASLTSTAAPPAATAAAQTKGEMSSSGRVNQPQQSAKMTTVMDTENLLTDGVVPDGKDSQAAGSPAKKSRRFWIILAVLVTLLALIVGLSTYFFFIHDDTSTVSKTLNSIGSGNEEDNNATPDKRDRPSEGGDLDTEDSTTTEDNGDDDDMASEDGDSTVAPEDEDSTTKPEATEPPEEVSVVATSKPSTPPIAPIPTASPVAASSMQFGPVLASVVPNAQAINDPATPQGAALVWLESENTLSLDTDNQIIQRYAVVTTAISLQGSVPSFLDSSISECEWEGVECAYRNATDIFDSGFDPAVNATADVIELVVVGIKWSNYSLTGSIPDDIGLLKSLQTLDLGENFIQGQIPGGLYQLQELEYLYLHGNQLGGSISTSIGNLQKLDKLLLADNKFTGTLPQELGTSSTGQARPFSESAWDFGMVDSVYF